MPMDAVTLTVVRNAISDVASEMDITLESMAFSPVISEARDRSSGIYNASDGSIIAQGVEAMPFFVSTMEFTVRSCLSLLDDLGPADVIITNDPYLGGSHLMDVKLVRPFFHGGELVAVLANAAHWVDIGGGVPGSYKLDARHVVEEGVRIPPIRLVRDGTLDQGILSLLLGNVRNPRLARGDLEAQLACLEVGRRRLEQVFDRFGRELVSTAVAELRARSADQLRDLLRDVPNGTFRAEAALDNDGVDPVPVRCQVAITVSRAEVTIDFDGSDPPCRGAFNAARASVYAGVWSALLHVFPEVTPSGGVGDAVTVHVPDKSFLNAAYPMPVSGSSGEVAAMVASAVYRALAQAVPDRCGADFYFSVGGFTIGGTRESGEEFVLFWFGGGGYGAHPDVDGATNGNSVVGWSRSTPVEVIERMYPVRIWRYELRPDSGGAGAHRGGLGAIIEVELLATDASLSVLADNADHPPRGAGGGGAGAGTLVEVVRASGDAVELPLHPHVSGLRLWEGDRVLLATPGGGGWGDPRLRSAGLVDYDRRNGYVTDER